MKTTSYEISKKLAEIGFKAPTFFIAFKPYENCQKTHVISTTPFKDEGLDKSRGEYLSYDLETILEALPKEINLMCGRSFLEVTFSYDNSAPYILYRNDDRTIAINSRKENDESLADTAARLLILLNEKGVIKL